MVKPRAKPHKPALAPKAAPTLSDRGNGGELHQIASTDAPDDGFLALKDEKSAGQFIKQCRALRFWEREAAVDADAD
jgi:hypothetical protein